MKRILYFDNDNHKQVCNPIGNETEDISFPLYVIVLFPHSKEKIMLIIGLMPPLQSLVCHVFEGKW